MHIGCVFLPYPTYTLNYAAGKWFLQPRGVTGQRTITVQRRRIYLSGANVVFLFVFFFCFVLFF